MEAGQIINSVQNIYDLCKKIAVSRGKKLQDMELGNVKDSGPDHEFVEKLMFMLETGSDYLEDLVTVLKDLNKEYRYEDID